MGWFGSGQPKKTSFIFFELPNNFFDKSLRFIAYNQSLNIIVVIII